MKSFRCYLNKINKWTHYDLQVRKQRTLVLSKIMDAHFDGKITEQNIAEIFPWEKQPQSRGPVQTEIFVEHNDWFRKPKPDGIEIKATISWYLDRDKTRTELERLANECETKELFYSADFTADYSRYDIEPDVLVLEDTKEAVFYQNIFEHIHEDKLSNEKIAKAVSNTDITITAAAVWALKKWVPM
jgi:hypothetical protein